MAFSPDGSTLAGGSWDETIRLWDVATGQEQATFESSRVWSVSVLDSIGLKKVT